MRVSDNAKLLTALSQAITALSSNPVAAAALAALLDALSNPVTGVGFPSGSSRVKLE